MAAILEYRIYSSAASVINITNHMFFHILYFYCYAFIYNFTFLTDIQQVFFFVLLFFSSHFIVVFVVRFIHEALARIPRETSSHAFDINKLID